MGTPIVKIVHDQSTLADLPAVVWFVDESTSTEAIKARFDRHPDLPGAIVRSGEKLLGIVARASFFQRLSGPYCRELFLRKSIRDFIVNWPMEILQGLNDRRVRIS